MFQTLRNKVIKVGRQYPATNAILEVIKEITYQPFIVTFIHEDKNAPRKVICKDQNVLGEFSKEFSDWRKPGTFVHAFLDAIEHEIYDAGFGWFDWILADKSQKIILHLNEPIYASHPLFVGYPSFEFYKNESFDRSVTSDEKAEMLIKLFNAYQSTNGNNQTRVYLCEGLALALSKYLGLKGQYKEAFEIVDKAMALNQKSLQIKACRHALLLKLENKPVPARLEKFVGHDNGALKGIICAEPFRRFDVGPEGDVYVCCGLWLPQAIGNIMTDEVEDILNSNWAKKLRLSMLDGSYKYCNQLECAPLIQGSLNKFEDVTDATLRAAIDTGKLTISQVSQLMFMFDQTCNLACPSCRTERIVEKPSQNQEKSDAVETKLMPILQNLHELFLNPAGELFVSKSSRKLLEMISREKCPNLWLDIISNGTVFSRKEWDKFPNIHNMVRSIRISVDACTKDTFEKLRFLGIFEVFVENMKFLAELRESRIIPQLKFSFTYQRDNFREMADFVRFARSFNCDFVLFERLQNLGAFTHEQFMERAVHLPHHPLHQEFLSVIRNPVFAEVYAWTDFEWEGAAQVSETVAKQRQHASLDYPETARRASAETSCEKAAC